MLGKYNVYFEMSALVFLIALMGRYFLSFRFPGRTNRLFGLFLLCAGADVVLDITTCFLLTQPGVSYQWNMALNTLFYCCHISIPTLMTVYVLSVAGRNLKQHRRALWCLLPEAIFLALLAVNLFSPGVVFDIVRAEDGLHEIQTGSLYILLYVFTVINMAATLGVVLYYRESMDKAEKRCIFVFVLIDLAMLVVQFLIPQLLLTGTSMSISLFIMMFTLQNPQAMVDKASGVFNYNALMEYTSETIRYGKRKHIVICELDGIGPIDRDFGMMTGNQYVTEVCDFFRSVAKSKWVFRVIGARFMIAAANAEEMHRIGAAIEARFREPWKSGKTVCRLSATVLCLETPGTFASGNEFIAFLDEVISRRGRDGRVHQLDNGESILQSVRRRQAVEQTLRAALRENRGLYLNYQPVYAAADGTMVSAEALCRLRTEELGQVPPDEFIRVAEHCGLAPQVDAFVIRTACGYLSRNPGLKRLQINLSGAEFYHDPTEYLLSVLAESNVDPHRICFEITETVSAHHPQTVRSFMEAMIARGYSFALDDFGVGYANISQVMHMPFEMVKLDRSLLQENDKTRMLLSNLLHMFTGLGKKTVSEGVETEQELSFVREHGAVYIQGYYFSRPLSGEDMAKLL